MNTIRWLAGAAVMTALAGNTAWADVITNIVVKDAGFYSTQCDGRSNRGAAPRLELSAETLVDWAHGLGSLLQFELRPGGVSVVPPGHVITNAQLRLRSFQTNNTRWKSFVVAYPLLKEWEEGVAGAGNPALPWFPTLVGDACPLFRYVTAIDSCTNLYYGGSIAIVTDSTWNSWKNNTNVIAKAGEPWAAMSGRGIGTDIADRKMVDELWTSANYPYLKQYAPGTYFPTLQITAEGLKVVEEWAKGTTVNHGLNIWAICPPVSMITNSLGDLVSVYPPRWSSREKNGAVDGYPTELLLFTAPINPRTLLLVR